MTLIAQIEARRQVSTSRDDVTKVMTSLVEALYRLHNETAANKKSPLNNNDDVIVMNKQPFSDVSKIPPVPNSQQQHR